MQPIVYGSSRSDRRFPYNGQIARWWLNRANDAAHKYAYRIIADFIAGSVSRPPRLIVDYACGAGNLLSLLSRRFTRSNLVGLDGSDFLLGLAERRFSRLPRICASRISLIQTSLPRFSLLRGNADLVVYCFPNMMPFPGNHPESESSFLSDNDRKIASCLSRAVESGCERRNYGRSLSIQRNLEQSRCVSLNLRRLLVRGGICVRVEYASTKRHAWSNLELQRVCFEEGTLENRVNGAKPSRWFQILASAYFRSRVLEDVYQQTGNEKDRHGGYLLTVLRAI